MKHKMLLFTGAVLLFVCLLAAANIDGKWKATIQTPNGDFEIVYNFKVVDDSLTGSVESRMGTREFVGSKMDEKGFSFDTEWNGMRRTNYCTVQGDSIIMKTQGRNGEERQMVLTKIK